MTFVKCIPELPRLINIEEKEHPQSSKFRDLIELFALL